MAGFNLSLYNERKDLLIDKLSKIAELSLGLGIKETAVDIEKSIAELKDDKFKVVVVGEFSRGKSTFINALVGKRILPSSTKPTTAILNKISYNETPVYRLISRNDNSCNTITEDEFRKIVAPKEPYIGNEESEQGYEKALEEISSIAYAHIGYPTELLKGGVEIVDTPGTNDLDAAREEITYKFIPESDVAIMLLAANQPLAESEMNFLKDRILKADIQKIYFVINFKDRISDEDEIKVINYVRNHLESVVDNPKIFMVSAKGALSYRRALNNEVVKGEIPTFESTGFLELEENISEFLANDRGTIKLSKFIERGIRISSDLRRNSVAISLGTLNIELEELEEKINKLRPEVERVRAVCNNSINVLRSSLMNLRLGPEAELRHGLDEIAYAAVKAVDNYHGPLTGEDIAKAVEHAVAPMQTELQYMISNEQKLILSDEVERVNRRLGYEWEAVNSSIINELTVHSADTALVLNSLHNKDDEDMLLLKTGASTLGILALVGALNLSIFALPAAIFGGKHFFSYFENKNREKIFNKARRQIDNRYRDVIPQYIKSFNKQWEDNVNSIVNNLKLELDRKYLGIEQQLNSILVERNKEQHKVDEKRAALLKQDELLQEVINDLKNLTTNLS
jgi:GTPase SAR1 family protein